MKLPPDQSRSGMDAFNQLLQQAGGAKILQNAQNNAERVIQRLEMTLVAIDQAVQKIAFQLDHTRLTVSMILDIIEENGILTREQIQEKYEKKVVVPIREIERQLKEELEQQVSDGTDTCALETSQEEPVLSPELEEEPHDVSEPILASERAGTKKVF